MFVRVKGNEPNRYLQMVENRRLGERTLQRVVATLGRVDELAGGGDALLTSLSRFAGRVQVLEGYRQGNLEAGARGKTSTTSEPRCQGWPEKRSKPLGSPSRPRFGQYQKMRCQRINPPI